MLQATIRTKAIGYTKDSEMMVRETLGATPTINFEQALINIVGEKFVEEVKLFVKSVSKLDVPTMSVKEIQEFGFTPSLAKRIFGALQFSMALINSKSDNIGQIRCPEDAAAYFMHLQFEKQEHFNILGLNVKNEVLIYENLFIGSLNVSVVHPREIFQRLYKINGIAGFIVGHCHPSGNPAPSPEDLDVTKRLVEAGKLLGIECLDHIIVGDGCFLSLKEKGYM